ncbi:hydroxyisourate hydrolase [Naumannella halotolerans]|uniref:5-hydroxyisourate hydrolase n=1 Tax=Naumannella halotolerans TaxID=993414 RepID=A0A4R7J7Z0_9ACTN|nr:hydroxyisourate hydrolase [Naumannella halotolerans]TDT33590.1 5-hydroxyisourate hydrolase [Naumannella halotolerans]
MPHLTTHVLDATTGTPARGVGLQLTRADRSPVAEGVTDDDGRAGLGPDRLDAGDYTLTFATGEHFAAKGVASFYPAVSITFSVEVAGDGTSPHYHVPLLLSPFAYSTYRGS